MGSFINYVAHFASFVFGILQIPTQKKITLFAFFLSRKVPKSDVTVADPGGSIPLYFQTKLRPEGPGKNFFGGWVPPSSQGMDDRAPPPYLKAQVNHCASITTLPLFTPEGVRSSPPTQNVITSTFIFLSSSVSILLNTDQILNYGCLDLYGLRQNSV